MCADTTHMPTDEDLEIVEWPHTMQVVPWEVNFSLLWGFFSAHGRGRMHDPGHYFRRRIISTVMQWSMHQMASATEDSITNFFMSRGGTTFVDYYYIQTAKILLRRVCFFRAPPKGGRYERNQWLFLPWHHWHSCKTRLLIH